MAFYRTKRVNGHEYRQLVRNCRERGKHRQVVIARVGKHETLEDALAEVHSKLADLGRYVEDRRARRWAEAAKFARRRILTRYGNQLDHYHLDGEIPTPEEIIERAQFYPIAPETNEGIGADYRGMPMYTRQRV